MYVFRYHDQFAGFPMASKASTDRLASLGRLGMGWTIARIVWGFIALTAGAISETNYLFLICAPSCIDLTSFSFPFQQILVVLDGLVIRTNVSEIVYTIELVRHVDYLYSFFISIFK